MPNEVQIKAYLTQAGKNIVASQIRIAKDGYKLPKSQFHGRSANTFPTNYDVLTGFWPMVKRTTGALRENALKWCLRHADDLCATTMESMRLFGQAPGEDSHIQLGNIKSADDDYWRHVCHAGFFDMAGDEVFLAAGDEAFVTSGETPKLDDIRALAREIAYEILGTPEGETTPHLGFKRLGFNFAAQHRHKRRHSYPGATLCSIAKFLRKHGEGSVSKGPMSDEDLADQCEIGAIRFLHLGWGEAMSRKIQADDGWDLRAWDTGAPWDWDWKLRGWGKADATWWTWYLANQAHFFARLWFLTDKPAVRAMISNVILEESAWISHRHRCPVLTNEGIPPFHNTLLHGGMPVSEAANPLTRPGVPIMQPDEFLSLGSSVDFVPTMGLEFLETVPGYRKLVWNETGEYRWHHNNPTKGRLDRPGPRLRRGGSEVGLAPYQALRYLVTRSAWDRELMLQIVASYCAFANTSSPTQPRRWDQRDMNPWESNCGPARGGSWWLTAAHLPLLIMEGDL